MGIYISGVGTPTSCFYCFAREKIDPDNIRCLVTGDVFEETFAGTIEKRHKDCPLIPVPPHGRLIDADACEDYFFEHLSDAGMAGAKNAIEEMPTIIQAEESKI